MTAGVEVPRPLRAIPGSRSPVARAWRMAEKIRRKLAHKIGARLASAADAKRGTYADAARVPTGVWTQIFPACDVALLRVNAPVIHELTGRFLEHRFDLLGSGWVRVEHGMECAGVAGHRHPPAARVAADGAGDWLRGRVTAANFAEARRLWSLVDRGYRPIDWHVDFKSGYRWRETTWCGHIAFGDQPGVDVKVPWELARMQHLTQFAHAFALARAGDAGWRPAAVYLREFRNEVLDFSATNPPRFGVNWQCAMDVAIRAANWVVAFALFRAAGAEFDTEFEQVFRRGVYEHGAHVMNHLEWAEHFRGNHYLANVVGVLFVAAGLPANPETDAWLAFGVRELVREFGTQFGADGGNFEASTNYHRLSAEMIVYGTAVVLGLPEARRRALVEYDPRRGAGLSKLAKPPIPRYAGPGRAEETPFPPWYWERLEKVFAFSAALADDSGRVPQFGDNDSGRFLKLVPVIEPVARGEAAATSGDLQAAAETDWAEDVLNHEHLLAALAGLVEAPRGARALAARGRAESAWVRDLARAQRWLRAEPPELVVGASPAPRADAPVIRVFADFGLVVAAWGGLRAVFRCGPVGQCGIGGHAHNDALSFELSVVGQPLVIDPGTYLYTPLPAERNRFRSGAAHSTLLVAGAESNPIPAGRRGLFLLREQARARIVEAAGERIVLEHFGFGVVHRRIVRLAPGALFGRDECALAGGKSLGFPIAPAVWTAALTGRAAMLTGAGGVRATFQSGGSDWRVSESGYSSGYGRLQANQTLRLEMAGEAVEWEIRVAQIGTGKTQD